MSDKITEIFDRLYCDHQAKVYKLALGLTGHAGDAEDITQEAFLRAFRSYHAFRGESSFFTWIYRITINVAHDYLKQRSKLRIYELTEDLGYSIEQIIDPSPANDPATELLAREAKYRCLHGFTECLPIKQRKVFCLAVTMGLPHKLVAEILDCSVSSVKTTLHRSRKRIAGYLEERCQLIKKSNPCHCNQWVRYGLQQGWITEQSLINPRPPLLVKAREEMIQLRSLRHIYQNLYREAADQSLAQRIREGIKNREWTIFS
jgi:RNA polymerase sigma-70 factor (ECF subfamily)